MKTKTVLTAKSATIFKSERKAEDGGIVICHNGYNLSKNSQLLLGIHYAFINGQLNWVTSDPCSDSHLNLNVSPNHILVVEKFLLQISVKRLEMDENVNRAHLRTHQLAVK